MNKTRTLWKDKKVVSMLSIFYKSSIMTKEAYRSGKMQPINISILVNEYNTFMKKVDLFDERLSFIDAHTI